MVFNLRIDLMGVSIKNTPFITMKIKILSLSTGAIHNYSTLECFFIPVFANELMEGRNFTPV